jgi:hypothetical protein
MAAEIDGVRVEMTMGVRQSDQKRRKNFIKEIHQKKDGGVFTLRR